MCLNSVALNLKWNKNLKAYIGEGYKNLSSNELSRYSRIGRWAQASGSTDNKKTKLNQVYVSSDYSGSYHPGFHIFLNYDDAWGYSRVSDYNDRAIYKVLFKNVICFGGNKTYHRDTYGMSVGSPLYKPCVIAEFMKIVEKMT